jgi:hypothetical protein
LILRSASSCKVSRLYGPGNFRDALDYVDLKLMAPRIQLKAEG